MEIDESAGSLSFISWIKRLDARLFLSLVQVPFAHLSRRGWQHPPFDCALSPCILGKSPHYPYWVVGNAVIFPEIVNTIVSHSGSLCWSLFSVVIMAQIDLAVEKIDFTAATRRHTF